MPLPSGPVTVIVNAAARGVLRRFDAEACARYLGRRGYPATVVRPKSADGTREAAAAAARRGEAAVFVAGGDGTLRTVADGLLQTKTALAAIPAGTVNVLARELGLPRGLRAAVDAHLAGQRVAMDVGRANGVPFLLMASAGWDAEVARDVSLALKRQGGDLAYVLRGVLSLPRLRPRFARWTVGLGLGLDAFAREAPVLSLVASNSRLYGGLLSFAPEATVDDGQLDIVALCPRGLRDGLGMAWSLVRRDVAAHPRSFTARTAGLEIETPGMPYQLDGDYGGETPLRLEVERRALLVSVPPGRLPGMFAAADQPGL